MAGMTDILIIGVVAVGGYFFYKRCIVDKQCGFDDGPGPGDPVPTPPGPTGCTKGYEKCGTKCCCNRVVKQCSSTTVARVNGSGNCVCVGCNPGFKPGGTNGNECVPSSAPPPTGCTKGYEKCSGGCCCNRVVKKCASNQIVGVLNGICQCKNCPTGTKAGGTTGNSCVPIGGTNVTVCGAQANGAQAWIARVANAMLGRMCISCLKGPPSITQILQGWPSLTQQCAMDNNCNTNKLHSSSSTFNKHFAKLMYAIAVAYKIGISSAAGTALVHQQNTGVWSIQPWNSGVPGFYTSTAGAQALQTRIVSRMPKRVMVV